jgi:hypothetical protein
LKNISGIFLLLLHQHGIITALSRHLGTHFINRRATDYFGLWLYSSKREEMIRIREELLRRTMERQAATKAFLDCSGASCGAGVDDDQSMSVIADIHESQQELV